MGVDWEDKDKLAFGMLVVPDGRIVCQKMEGACFTDKWQATVFRRLPKYETLTTERLIDSTRFVLCNMFRIRPNGFEASHLASHFVTEINKRLEIVVCRLFSGQSFRVGQQMRIKLLTFNDLLDDMDKNRKNYAMHTVHAINVLGTLATWRSVP